MQVSWESAAGDLEHKVAVAKAILERGDRLELVFAHKKGAAQHALLSGSKLKLRNVLRWACSPRNWKGSLSSGRRTS